MQRIEWIDYTKCFGIFLVVLGHTAIPLNYINFIYAFHMPLFFFISGYLFDYSKFTSFNHFFKHRLKQLMLPYLWFNVLTYAFWFFVGRKFGNDVNENISPLTPLIGIFYGTDTGNYLIHCGSLWFLPCLFTVEILYFLICKKINHLLILLGFTILAYLNIQSKHLMLPLSFDVALVAVFFYAIANSFKSAVDQLISLPQVFKLIISLVSFFLVIILSQKFGRTDMSSNTYPNYLVFLMNALFGIIFTLTAASFKSRILGAQNWIEFIAKNTLILLAFHAVLGSVLKGFLFFIFKIPLSVFDLNLGFNLLLTLSTFITSIPLIFILNNYLPFMLGRWKSKQARR